MVQSIKQTRCWSSVAYYVSYQQGHTLQTGVYNTYDFNPEIVAFISPDVTLPKDQLSHCHTVVNNKP